MTRLLVICLGLIAGAHLPATGADFLPATDLPTAPAVPHITDGQDRLLTGWLSPTAETKSRANALYAEASLQLDSATGDGHVALDLLRQVTALDPTFADAQVKLAHLLLQEGKNPEALTQLKIALGASPGSASIQSLLGYIHHLDGKNDEAMRFCSDALRNDADQTMATRVLLEIASDSNGLARGVEQIEAIFKAGGDKVSASPWLMLGRIYLENVRSSAPLPSDTETSQTLLRLYLQAAAKNPPDASTLMLVADTYRDLGRRREALTTLRRAIALEPSNVDILLNCADLEIDLGQTAEALQHEETAYALSPSLPGLRETLARLDLACQRYGPAAQLLQAAVADFPEDQTLRIDLGVAYDGSNLPDKAQLCFSQAISSPICPPDAYLKLAAFQLSKMLVSQAGDTLAQAEKRFPKSARVRFYQAIQQRAAHRYAVALASLKAVRALATGPDAGVMSPNYYFEVALNLGGAGRREQIPATLSEGLSRFPEHAGLLNELAYYWADENTHLPEALDLSRRALQLDPASGPIQDTCGWVYFRLGQIKEALPYLQRAAVLTNNDPVVLQHLGDAYLKLGRERDAIATWRRALEQAPGNRDLADRIDAAQAQANNAQRSAPRK